MNERTAVLGAIADMQTLLTEAAHDLNSRIDWNVSIGAIASRTAVVDPITSTMIRQFADTLAAVANLAIDNTDHDAAQAIDDAIRDAFVDRFHDQWSEVESAAEEACRERIAA